jgi:hypothetical protein
MARLADLAHRKGARPAGHDAAQRALFDPYAPPAPQVAQEAPRDASHAPQVCSALIMGHGLNGPCAMPIRYSDGEHGATAGWYHLSVEINDHDALPY